MEDAIKQLKALSDPTRLRIMLLLMSQELCVCELETVLEMEQSRLSHALRALHDAELIEERREGRWIFYTKSSKLPSSLIGYLEESFRDNENSSVDRRKAKSLLETNEPFGGRCPLREKT